MGDDAVIAKLAEWEALAEGATPGPWSTFATSWDPDARGVDVGDDGDQMLFWHAGSGIPVATAADAEFIAAARTAMPALIAAVKDVRAACEKAKANPAEDGSVKVHTAVIEQALTKWIGGEG